MCGGFDSRPCPHLRRSNRSPTDTTIMATASKQRTTEEPTVDFLMDHFSDNREFDPGLTLEQAEKAVTLLTDSRRDTAFGTRRYVKPDKRRSEMMQYLNEVLDLHGVHPVRNQDEYHGYYGNAVYLYLNTGHMYGTTLIYDVRNAFFIVGALYDVIMSEEQG